VPVDELKTALNEFVIFARKLQGDEKSEAPIFSRPLLSRARPRRRHRSRRDLRVSRCEDPVPRARRYLREAVGFQEELADPKVNWASRSLPNREKSEVMIGWTSVVHFSIAR